MTLNETKSLVGVAIANFPSMQERDMGPTAMLWHQMLKDIPYEIAKKALLKVLTTAKYFPTVSEMLEAIADIVNPETNTVAEAWGEVERAIGNYGHRREAEALENMSPRTAKVVKYMGWRDICLSTELGVARGQFMKMYQQVSKRGRKEHILPESLKADIKRLSESMGMKMIKEGENGD